MRRRTREACLFAVAYGVLAWVALAGAREAGASALVWPVNAVAIGVLLVLGRLGAWPYAAAAVAGGVVAHLAVGDDIARSVFTSLVNGVQIATVGWAFAAAGIRRDEPARISAVTGLVVIACLGSLPSALLGAAALWLTAGLAPLNVVWSWWVLEAVSMLLFVPPFLFWRHAEERAAAAVPSSSSDRRKVRVAEVVAASAALTAAGLLVPISGQLILIELSGTVLLWFALRFGVFATALSSAIFASCVTLAALFDFWPGAETSAPASLMLLLQGTLALTTLPALLIAVVMSQRERARRLLVEDERRLAYALEGANDGIWDWHLPSGRAFVSARAQRMLGREPSDRPMTLEEWSAQVHPDDAPAMQRAFRDHIAGKTPLYESEFRCRHEDGRWIWTLGRGKVVERGADGEPLRAVGTHTDISERKRLEQALEHLATHDPLTGLANRGVFERGLIRASARLERQGGRVAVILIDIDHFKAVNDTYGHAVGDALLVATAERLRAVVRTDDLVARLGGDEFAVLASGQSAAEFDALAERMCRELAEPLAGEGYDVAPSVSIGLAIASTQVGDDLVIRADRALYAAKSAGRNTWRHFGGGGRAA